jgi:starch phosphorylase
MIASQSEGLTIMADRSIAYFTMEIALETRMPTYSGGLGVLAGDTIRAAADLRVPMVAVSLLHRHGYFRQHLDAQGSQSESPVDWRPQEFLTEEPARAAVTIEGRTVALRAWRYDVRGVTGHEIPVYFLDTDLPENGEWDRQLTDSLYGGDEYLRLCQEVVLGIGGVRMLRALGLDAIERFHMNEGHAALLTIELLEQAAERAGHAKITSEHIEAVREQCVFTTHTPVPAGHDQFPLEVVRRVLGTGSAVLDLDLEDLFLVDVFKRILRQENAHGDLREIVREGVQLNMTYLALNLSSYVNGVAKKHGEVSRLMFAGYSIEAITNGVHAATWAAPPLAKLFDRHMPGWREDNYCLRYGISLPRQQVWEAHQQAKRDLIELVRQRHGITLNDEVLTLGFARRAATYKRADLLFNDLDRLRRIATQHGGLQIVYAGKAHPRDAAGKDLIRNVHAAARQLADVVPVVYLENYDTDIGRLITTGVDVWLNTPLPPNEASGTSGMKAALNGVPNLSILDGWWIEGHIENVTGWSIGEDGNPRDRSVDAESLYGKLEYKISPMYYQDRGRFIDIMRHSIALNGSFFNTQRMVQQYVVGAYL